MEIYISTFLNQYEPVIQIINRSTILFWGANNVCLTLNEARLSSPASLGPSGLFAVMKSHEENLSLLVSSILSSSSWNLDCNFNLWKGIDNMHQRPL